MSRTGRRHSMDYLEENENLQESFEEYEYFDFQTESETDAVDVTEATQEEISEEIPEENAPERSVAVAVLLSIAKVFIVILALVGLFFASMKITQNWIGKNQEAETYNNDAPIYEDDIIPETPSSTSESDKTVTDDAGEETKDNQDKESSENTPEEKPEEKPEQTPSKPEEEKPEDKPSEPEKEEPSEPSTPTTPSEPSKPDKPSITPGNPAA